MRRLTVKISLCLLIFAFLFSASCPDVTVQPFNPPLSAAGNAVPEKVNASDFVSAEDNQPTPAEAPQVNEGEPDMKEEEEEQREVNEDPKEESNGETTVQENKTPDPPPPPKTTGNTKNHDDSVAVTAPVQETQPVPPQEKDPEPGPDTPLSYVWKAPHTVRFRSEVTVTNTGSVVSNNIRVAIPMLENNSPYQTTRLDSTSHPVTETSGRVSTFVIESLEPGAGATITADYTITMRPVSLSSTNETVEKARIAFNKHAGSGNCHTLAVNFVNECRKMGLTARVVTGFARVQRTNMTSGSLSGSRHSWAEFYVDGLGWVPTDLTFKYFAGLPLASHIVETYEDQSIKIRFRGSTLSASWHNSVL